MGCRLPAPERGVGCRDHAGVFPRHSGHGAVSFRAEYRTPLELVGETGVLRADDALNVERPITLELRRAGSVVGDRRGFKPHWLTRNKWTLSRRRVEGKAKFPVPGEEGWQNQEILDAAYRSLKSGKTEDVLQVTVEWPAHRILSGSPFVCAGWPGAGTPFACTIAQCHS